MFEDQKKKEIALKLSVDLSKPALSLVSSSCPFSPPPKAELFLFTKGYNLYYIFNMYTFMINHVPYMMKTDLLTFLVPQ